MHSAWLGWEMEGSLSYPSYAQALVTGFRPCSGGLAVPASPPIGLGWALGALMFTVDRTNPVNGILPLTGLIRSTAFPCPPEYRAGQRTSFPFPNTTSKLVGLFFTSVSHPALFFVYAQEERLVQGLWWLCCVCCAPPQGTRPPWSLLGFRDTAGPVPPPGCHWHCPVKAREEREGTRLPLPQRSVKWKT